MPLKGQRDLAKERRWREIIRDFERSGLSGPEFCRREALRYTTFADWRREIAARDKENREGRSESVRASRTRSKENQSALAGSKGNDIANFAEVKVVESTAEAKLSVPEPQGEIAVLLRNGILVRVSEQCSLEFTASILSLVENR